MHDKLFKAILIDRSINRTASQGPLPFEKVFQVLLGLDEFSYDGSVLISKVVHREINTFDSMTRPDSFSQFIHGFERHLHLIELKHSHGLGSGQALGYQGPGFCCDLYFNQMQGL